jgi:ArsR family transcriptional regulator
MKESDCVAALAALAHEHRLRVFRLLVRNGRDGVSAGDIAAHLALAPSSLSFHLGHLERTGLIRSRREQRRIIYAADLDVMGGLLSFLTEDCCGGHPEICASLMPAVAGVERRSTPSGRSSRSSSRD